MRKKTVSGLMLALLLAGMLTLAFKVQPAKAWTGTVYIRADGSIDPPDAPITTHDKITYTLAGDITSDAHGIVVWRDNIVFDGVGYTVQGTGASGWVGIYLKSRSNTTIKNTRITTFDMGVYLNESSGNDIIGNNIVSNKYGIWFSASSSNSLNANNIVNNDYGVGLHSSSNNSIIRNNIVSNGHGIGFFGHSYNNSINGNAVTNNTVGVYFTWYENYDNRFWHNNFIDNTEQCDIYARASISIWDNSYPSGGNFWSDYNGTDIDGDGIGDTPYVIDVNNEDRYPLIVPPFWNYSTPVPIVWRATIYLVALSSNSTVYTFKFNQPQMQISFYVAGAQNTVGYCNVTIPKTLLTDSPWTITIDDVPTDYTKTENGTHTFIYFIYKHTNTNYVVIRGSRGIKESPPNIFQDPKFSAIFMVAFGFLGIGFGIGFLRIVDKLKKWVNKYSERTRNILAVAGGLLLIAGLLVLVFLFISMGVFGFPFWVEWLLRGLLMAIAVGLGIVGMAHIK